MKVYVCTKAVPFGEEIYVDVAGSKKAAEKKLRVIYPHMKSSGFDSYVSDASNSLLLFIHEEEI